MGAAEHRISGGIRRYTGSRRHSSGFTLVELVTVLVIIGVLAVVAVIRWPGPAINVDGAAEQLAADIRYVQALAMTRGRAHGVAFSGNSYSAFADNGATVPLGDGTQTRTLSGITLSSSAGDIGFDHLLGEPDAGGDVVVTLSAGGSLREVVVHGATGYVEVQRP